MPDSANRQRPSAAQWVEFNPTDLRYHTCGGRMHVKDATGWVNIGQAAVAIVELMLFTAFYLIDWTDPSMAQTFDTKFLILGICLFVANLFFACILHAGLRYESCGMIVADLGWMTVTTALRGLSIVLLVVELVHFPGSASWLSAGLIAAAVSFIIQCLSCYILARCAYYMRHVRLHRRRTEAIAAARLLLVQYWRPPPGHRHPHPPPPYNVAQLMVPPAYEVAAENASSQGNPVPREVTITESAEEQKV